MLNIKTTVIALMLMVSFVSQLNSNKVCACIVKVNPVVNGVNIDFNLCPSISSFLYKNGYGYVELATMMADSHRNVVGARISGFQENSGEVSEANFINGGYNGVADIKDFTKRLLFIRDIALNHNGRWGSNAEVVPPAKKNNMKLVNDFYSQYFAPTLKDYGEGDTQGTKKQTGLYPKTNEEEKFIFEIGEEQEDRRIKIIKDVLNSAGDNYQK